jgi:hypothetical protein
LKIVYQGIENGKALFNLWPLVAAGFLELVVGIPLAISTTFELDRFSLFSLGPIFSLGLVVVFLWPNLWERLPGTDKEPPATQTP